MKTLALMQPYFFPYIGYFMLIKHSDAFVILDAVQYIKDGWIKRNRILKPSRDDWQYVTVPVKKFHETTKIKDIEIDNTKEWKKKFFAQLSHYKSVSPYYAEVMDLLEYCLSIETNSINKLNGFILASVCDYLGITTPISFFSDYSPLERTPSYPDEWSLFFCKKYNYDRYINAPGGMSFFRKEQFLASDIKLEFIKPIRCEYSQRNINFISELSIIDLLFFNSKQQIDFYLQQVEFIN